MTGTMLFLITCVFAWVSRYYEIQIIQKKGISSVKLYPAYLQVRGSAVVYSSQGNTWHAALLAAALFISSLFYE